MTSRVTQMPLSPIHFQAANSSFPIPNQACTRTSSPRTPVAFNRKRLLEPAMPSVPTGENITHLPKKRKIVETSFNPDQTRAHEAKEYMTTQMLHLARKSRDVYNAKIRYQHLRMQELEMIKTIMHDELEDAQGSLHRTEHQIGQIRKDLCGTKVMVGGNIQRWGLLFGAPSGASSSSDSDGDSGSDCSSDSECSGSPPSRSRPH